MTFDEVERLMQFILEHQVQFSVDMGKARERMAESDERIARIEVIQENAARQIEHIGSALIALTESHTRTQEALARLAESQAHGDRRLDALTDIVRGGKGTGQ